MKRTKFIAVILTVLAAPSLAFLKFNKLSIRKGKGFKILAGEGRIHGHIQLKGVNSNVLDVKISGGDTDGDLAIFEQTSIPQGKGTPLHIHYFQDEIFYLIEGSYKFQLGDDKYDLSVGDRIFLQEKLRMPGHKNQKGGKCL